MFRLMAAKPHIVDRIHFNGKIKNETSSAIQNEGCYKYLKAWSTSLMQTLSRGMCVERIRPKISKW